jgi:hypothetical protein
VLDPENLEALRDVIRLRAQEDKGLLDALRAEVRPLRTAVRRIHPRTTTAMSLVASDGGNNKLQFDPFLIQLVRVVDSYGRVLCLDAVSPTTDTDRLSDMQFEINGEPHTALGYLMRDLGVKKLHKLSPMIPAQREPDDESPVKASWVLVYRDLCEWAVLYERIRRFEFATDTLIVRDGLLRSKIFSKGLFIKYREGIEETIQRTREKLKRRLFLVGLAKHSKVLQRYQLAMNIEKIMTEPYPCFVEIPHELERKAVTWGEYATGPEEERHGKEPAYFVAGKMFFAKFGNKPLDPVWAVDLLHNQVGEAAEIFSYLLADSIDGFPVPFYPMCLQKAHEHAALVGFDMDILQDAVIRAIKAALESDTHREALEVFQLRVDPSGRRYG